jgi:Tfp pilus assembly protein PilO
VSVLDECRKNLSVNKRVWTGKFEALKKQVKDANEVYKREYAKYTAAVAVFDDLKKKKDDMYKKFGLALNEQIQFDNMPKDIQKTE